MFPTADGFCRGIFGVMSCTVEMLPRPGSVMLRNGFCGIDVVPLFVVVKVVVLSLSALDADFPVEVIVAALVVEADLAVTVATVCGSGEETSNVLKI